MKEKIIKSGLIGEHFRLWMEATFGWDMGQFILLENWTGKHIPCKYDPKSWGIRSGYYEEDRFTLAECYKWELVEFENHTSLRFWYKYGDDANFATTQTYLIEKCVRLPRIEQLDMETYGL